MRSETLARPAWVKSDFPRGPAFVTSTSKSEGDCMTEFGVGGGLGNVVDKITWPPASRADPS